MEGKMNTAKLAGRFLLGWMALLAAQFAAGAVIHVNVPQMPNVLPWLVLSDAIVAVAIGAAAMRSGWTGWKLGIAIFAVLSVIAEVNLIEGVIFLTGSHIDWSGTMRLMIAGYAIVTVLWTFIYGRPAPEGATTKRSFPERGFFQNLWRLVFCSATYVVLYFTAGMIIFPYVRDFYATQHIPGMGEIVALQFLLRGPMFVLVCLVLMRMFRLPGLSGALAVGVAFTLLSGVAVLIIPNPFFPDAVRWVHFCEVGSSNLVFGFVVGWVWGERQRVAGLAPAHA
jgi:hypothetical protein